MSEMTENEYQRIIQAEGRIKHLLDLIDEFYQKQVKGFQQKPSDQEVIALFVGGGSCSGKSTLRRHILDEYDNNSIIIDSDELKKIIPEYDGLFLNYGFKTASIVHNESSKMASFLIDKVIEECNNFLYDGTLKNTEKYQNLFQLLKQHNYVIHLHIVDCQIDLARKRNEARAISERRAVPFSVIKESHERIVNSFVILSTLVDEWHVYNTDGDKPEIIASNGNVFNQDLYQAFLSKQTTL